MIKKLVGTLHALICFVLISQMAGCGPYFSSYQPVNKYKLAKDVFFKEQTNNYKIAYSAPADNFWPPRKRSDIFITDFDGTNKNNITQSLYPQERVISLFPTWSPDGRWLLFTLVRNLEVVRDTEVVVTVELYLWDSTNSASLRKVYSYKYERHKTSDRADSFKNCAWSKDSKNILVSQIDKTTRILVSADELIPPKDFLTNNYTDFVQTRHRLMLIEFGGKTQKYISPDGNYELSVVQPKDISLGPKGSFMPNIGDFLCLHIREDSLYLSKKNSFFKKKIFDGITDFFWTKDNKYIVLFSINLDKFYIVNLKGQSITVDGAYPDIQYSVYNLEKNN